MYQAIKLDELIIYKNKECTESAQDIDFGRPYVGSKNKVELYIRNESSDWPIENITVISGDKDVIITHPVKLNPFESKKITIEWTPDMNRRKPLSAQHIFVGDLLIG
jgi:hypothetical protein